jgi:hypothetical protein
MIKVQMGQEKSTTIWSKLKEEGQDVEQISSPIWATKRFSVEEY